MQFKHNGSPGSALPDAHLAQRLATLIDGVPEAAPAPVGHNNAGDVNEVITSLTHWTPSELAAFSEQLLTDPAIVYAQHPGVTRSRIRAILPNHRKAQAEQVLHWLDVAQVLARAITQDAPFRHPRPIACATAADLADRLAAVPYPASAEHKMGHHAACVVSEAG
jgi:hypothetical protein